MTAFRIINKIYDNNDHFASHFLDFMFSNTTNPCENVSSVLPATNNVSIISHSGSGKRIDKGLISSGLAGGFQPQS